MGLQAVLPHPDIAIAVRRSVKASLNNESGTLVFNSKHVCYVPNVDCQLAFSSEKVELANVLVQSTTERSLLSSRNASQLANYLLSKVVVTYDNIKTIFPRRKNHRETGLEIYTT